MYEVVRQVDDIASSGLSLKLEIGASRCVRAFALHPGKIITGLQCEMSSAEQVERGWPPGLLWSTIPIVAVSLAPEGCRGRVTAHVFLGGPLALVAVLMWVVLPRALPGPCVSGRGDVGAGAAGATMATARGESMCNNDFGGRLQLRP